MQIHSLALGDAWAGAQTGVVPIHNNNGRCFAVTEFAKAWMDAKLMIGTSGPGRVLYVRVLRASWPSSDQAKYDQGT